jgi:hypothetical protein
VFDLSLSEFEFGVEVINLYEDDGLIPDNGFVDL